jgi:hypothetical protein
MSYETGDCIVMLVSTTRDQRLQPLVTNAERVLAFELAKRRGVSVSELVRDLLRREHERVEAAR